MITAREKIFKKLKKFQNNTPLEIKTFKSEFDDIVGEFIKNATIAGAVVYSNEEEIKKFNDKNLDRSFRYSSTLGVAENGALWCFDLPSNDRAKLFTCTELVISINKQNLVSNMHEAYKKIDLNNKAFGTFIAGPSKTADIEQSLVIGAHGAMGLHIILQD